MSGQTRMVSGARHPGPRCARESSWTPSLGRGAPAQAQVHPADLPAHPDL